MKTEDLINAFGDIDDDLFAEPDDAEEAVEIRIEYEKPHISLIRIAAACFAVMAAGMFAVIKYRINEGQSIDSSTNAGDIPSYESSSVSVIESSGSSVTEEEIKFTALERYGENVPLIQLTQGEPDYCVQKTDSADFAVFDIEDTNATEENPVYFIVCCADYSGFDFFNPVSKKIAITGPGKYIARYDKKYPALSMSYIYAETCGESYGDGGYGELDGLEIKGTWMP